MVDGSFVDLEIADENAFLILENIKHLGFRNGNHGIGLDKYETEIIIKVFIPLYAKDLKHSATFTYANVFFLHMVIY